MKKRIAIEFYRGKENRQGLQFDLPFVMTRLFQTFPGIVFEEERYRRQAETLRQIIKEMQGGREPSEDDGAVRISRRDAEELGPHFTFWIAGPDSVAVMKGAIRRHTLCFWFNERTDLELRQKAEDFLNSFSLKRTDDETVDEDQ